MRKSILIGVLAALMLFAFTACEPGTNTVIQESGNKTAMVATLVDFDGYLAGTTAAEAGLDNGVSVVANITYDNGYVLENVAGKLTSASAVVSGTNWGTFTYGDSQTLNVQFNGVPATELKLEVAETAKTEYVKDDIKSATTTIDTDDITATLVFENGEEISAKSVTYKFNGTAAASYYDSTAVIATVTGTGLTADGKDLTAEYEIKVTDYTGPAPVEAKGLAVFYSVGDGAETTTAPSTLYIGQTVNISVWTIDTATYTANTSIKLEDVTSEVVALNGTTFTNSVPVTATTDYDATIAYNGLSTTVSVGNGTNSDSIVEDSVSVDYDKDKATTFVAGHKFTDKDFKATYQTLSGNNSGQTVTLSFAPANPEIPATDAPKSVNVQVKAEYEVMGEDKVEYFIVNVPVYTAG